MRFEFRSAIPEDAEQCIVMRGKTRENSYSIEALAAIGITLDNWRSGIENGSSPGYVCLHGDLIIGMSFYDNETGEILVVAVLPDFEGKGIGNKLLQNILADLRTKGYSRSFLSCNPSSTSRSFGFYRHMGWKTTGNTDSYGDQILEMIL
jgi:ribosomal protein S18 acetylase RimI-like enzyme